MNTQTKPKVIKIDTTPIMKDTLERYILVGWPEIQKFMDHPRWHECIFCLAMPGHPCPDSSFMVPESLYKEII